MKNKLMRRFLPTWFCERRYPHNFSGGSRGSKSYLTRIADEPIMLLTRNVAPELQIEGCTKGWNANNFDLGRQDNAKLEEQHEEMMPSVTINDDNLVVNCTTAIQPRLAEDFLVSIC
ncbi:hypothetical protein TIFTF001_016952 [Ficus carica]|uniref:Uncharacterized protein n=1 Tax=Ficus carica TaxID=3494 RepID=A0AA88A8N9_FICCA|nr:hypothetical protein TIFTF001_016952 [Ficus carica]